MRALGLQKNCQERQLSPFLEHVCYAPVKRYETQHILILNMDFSERIRALRKERGLSQQTLAEAVGIHVTQMRRYEAGRSQPSLDVLRNLAKTLRVNGRVLGVV